jgi:hypothetical protein
MFELEELIEDVRNYKYQCKGLFFRCNINKYFTNNKYVDQVSFTLLKRMSCKGCTHCKWMLDGFSDHVMSDTVLYDEAIDKAVYRLDITNIHTDWETGIVDDWNLIFVKVYD